MRIFLIVVILSICSGCFIANDVIPDQQTWIYGQPSEVGLREESLLSLNTAISQGYYGNVFSVCVIKNNLMVFENYYDYYKREDLINIGNASYGITCLALDFFIQRGLINDLDQPIHELLPDYEDIFEADTLKKQITIQHLLDYTSGLVWDEGLYPVANKNDFDTMRVSSDWVRFVLSQQMESIPGRRSSLHSGVGIILMKIYQNLINEPLIQFLDNELFQKMGIENYQWESDPNGILNGGDGLSLTTLDYTKFGYLFLLEGRWTKNERIISRDWIFELSEYDDSFRPEIGLGAGWWRYDSDYLRSYSSISTRMISIHGTGGKAVYVVPDENMIVTIMAQNPEYGQATYNPSLSILTRSLYALNSIPF